MGPGAARSEVDVEFEPADPRRRPAAALLEAMTAELNALYGTADRLRRPALDPSELLPPEGAYLVGRVGAGVVAGGGLRRLDGTTAEIKRMFVEPAWRGRGVAGALLRALEEEGRRLGFGVARLDTGPRQPHAKRLYLAAGYREIAAYNDNPYADFWAEKVLGPALH
ncbi:MAG: GNAT family N-acetyltransferase [Acidimicrobiales bacterium]